MTDNIVEMMPEMVTMKEAAQRSGISYGRIRRMVLSGRVAYRKIGREYLINWNRFIDFMNGSDSQIGSVI